MPVSTATVALVILKAVAIIILAKIAFSDYRTQKIRNEQVFQLLVIAVAIQAVDYLLSFDLLEVELSLAASALLFVALIGFWLGGKVGAGDVKLLTTIPLLVGLTGSFPFVIAMMVFSLLIVLFAKYPMLLPEKWFRSYAEAISANGRVPFGIPIAAAAVVSLLLPPSAWWQAAPSPSPYLQPCPPALAASGEESVAFPDWMTSNACK